jgi:homoserine O-succinyltransferase
MSANDEPASAPRGSAGGLAAPLEIAFVNNMPDAAFHAAQAQFRALLESGAGPQPFNMRLYLMPGVERSEIFKQQLQGSYEDIETLYVRGADAVVVTGSEPRAHDLKDEAYWRHFVRLTQWARSNTVSTLWSCLAAHAAVHVLDGVERVRGAAKTSGVFSFETVGNDWLTLGAPAKILVPHSRYYGLRAEDLERCGYTLSTLSPTVGVDAFSRCEPSVFVFLQGHPEYDVETLCREYRRDVLRFMNREQKTYPEEPKGYFAGETLEALQRVRRSILAGNNDSEATLSEILGTAKYLSDWSANAVRLYRNWMKLVSAGRTGLRRSA